MLVFASSVALCQQPGDAHQFSFKGAYLGMSLVEFKELNKREIWINTGDPRKRKDRDKAQVVFAPLCSDQYDIATLKRSMGFFMHLDAPIDAPQQNEIVCFTTSGSSSFTFAMRSAELQGFNPEGRTIAGVKATNLHYRFFQGKLYRIRMWFTPSDMTMVLSAFNEKYGSPQQVNAETFQNGFGATWQGEIYIWKHEGQVITLKMGSGRGPGQNPFEFNGSSGVDIVDSSVADNIPTLPTGKIDF
jgi:hypothetical protein